MVVAAALLMMAMKQTAGGFREGAKGKQPGAGRAERKAPMYGGRAGGG
jgi:hypothetical protein